MAVGAAGRMARVLIVEDDASVRASLERALSMDGYDMASVGDGAQALTRLLEASEFDAVVLDLGLPGLDGLEVCRRMRAAGDRTPVLMLTARDAIDDRVEGLEAGADDYLVKPFALRELLARLHALLRRMEPEAGHSHVLRLGDLRLDLHAMEARRGDARLELTRTEFALLRYFLENPGRVLTRVQLFEHVWGYDFGASSNALGVYIGYLRRKLEDGARPRLLHTVRGVGYVLRIQS